MRWAAVILSGGAGSRLGGADKGALRHDGRTFLEHAREAVSDADEVVVVGPEVDGGPLAAVAAGVAGLTSRPELVVLLAVDMPHVGAATVSRLLAAVEAGGEDCDGAWLTGADGRRQLAGAVRPGAVPAPSAAAGAPMRLLMQSESARDVPAVGREAEDVDTWDDLARLD
ncbi:MAG: NTP transferase domain-containing protein [Nocardioides sp.]